MHSCQLRLTKVWESSTDGNFPLQSNPSKSENLEIGGIFLQNLILSEIFWEIREFSVPIFQNQKILPKFFSIDFDQVLWAKRWQSNKIELNRSDWINGIQLAELNWTSIKIMIRPKNCELDWVQSIFDLIRTHFNLIFNLLWITDFLRSKSLVWLDYEQTQLSCISGKVRSCFKFG